MHDLRPYQIQGRTDIFNSWKAGHRRTMFQLVTGGGKTVLFVDIIKNFLLKKKRALLIAHREELITQGFDTLYKNQIYSGIIKADVKPNYHLPCQIASIQTATRRKVLPPADIVIIDEAHHALEDNSYGNLLLDHYPKSWVLGVTATPYRLGGKGFTDIFDNLVTGPTFKDLVNWGYLTPLRYFVAGRPDLSVVRLNRGDYDQEGAAKAMQFAPLVESYLEHCAGMSGVVFAVNIEHSHKIVGQYLAAGISAAHLDANTPSDQRKDILKKFKAGIIKVISNVGIITEGFDFPDMEFVQLARPTKSLSLFLQMIGRVTRTDYNAIRNATSDDERRLLVSMSKKPFGYVLDNAGLWEEHGMPDQEFNWQRYFNGIPKREKSAPGLIEILEFVAEDESGRQVRTKKPEEIDGLKLIEVNKIPQEKIVNIASLKEFDRLLAQFINLASRPNAHIKKPGFVAYQEYKNYCRKNNYAMGPEVWDYLIKKLSHEPEERIQAEKKTWERTLDALHDQYQHNKTELNKLIDVVTKQSEKKIAPFKRYLVPEGFLKKERSEYWRSETVKRVA